MKTISLTNRRTLAVFAAMLLAPSSGAWAAGLKQAEFTRVINDVRVMPVQQQPAPAKLGDKISGQTGVSTGASSRAELTFSDRTITRIGANSLFKLDKAERTVDLEKGVILLQVPKQIGGAKVRTAAVTAAVTGTTVMVEYAPNGAIKIIVLEGEVDVYLNDNPSVMRTLVAGDMLILPPTFPPGTKVLPIPAKIDLELLKKTSKLMDVAEFGPLGNQKYLADALKDQQSEKDKGELLKTAFEIMGRGTRVTLTNEARQEIFKNLVLRDRPATNGGNASGGAGGNGSFGGDNSTANGSGNAAGNGNLPNGGGGLPSAINNPGITVFGAGSSIVTNPHATAFNSITGGVTTMQGTIYQPLTDGQFNRYMYGDAQTFPEMDEFLSNHGNWFVFKGDELFISGDIAVDSSRGPRNVLLGASGNVTLSAYVPAYGSGTTDSSWTIPATVDALALTSQYGSITLESLFELRGSGGPQDVAFYAYGPASDVFIYGNSESSAGIYVESGTFKAHAGRDIVTDRGHIEAGEVKLNARRNVDIHHFSSINATTLLQIEALQNIRITNSSQLVALGEMNVLSVLLKAVNGNVEIGDSYLDAANVEMVSGAGGISLTNSTILADVIKARAMGTGGELLISNSILGRDTPSASSLIKLYGEGTGGVRFVGDNTLNAVSTDIAGRTVTIENGGKVRLSHPAGTRVFSDTANFNNGGVHGNFTDKAGTPVSVTKDLYDHRPAY